MPPADPATPAAHAIEEFGRHLTSRGLSATTRRIRVHFLRELLRHALAAGPPGAGEPMTVAELMTAQRAAAWLADAAAGRTRSRGTARGREAAAYPNSMRSRADTWNGFAEFLGLPARLAATRPADGFRLPPDEAGQLVHDLAVRRPVLASKVTALRTAAVAALVADTGHGVPELARLQVSALRLTATPPCAEVGEEVLPLRAETVHVLSRWLSARAEIIAALDGSDPGYLWLPVKPGRPRGGDPPVKPGLVPAAIRTLHHAHRVYVSQMLGTPLRPGALRGIHDDDPSPGGRPPAPPQG